VIKIDSPIPTENIAQAVTDRLPEDIAVTSAEQADKSFDVIRDAKRKLYRYTIFNGKTRPVLHIRHCWYFPYRMDVKAMEKAANYIVGTNDFKSFASAADKRKNSVRTVFHCRVTKDGDWIYIEVEGDGFLYNMVRNIAGTLAEIGRGQRAADDIPKILRAKDRKEAGMLAPANGLCLCWIKY
jgi:tRNA pseudouridine38-40 synthase